MANRENLFIDAETVIVGLLAKERSRYVDMERLSALCDHIHRQLVEKNVLERYQAVVFDVNYNSVRRTAECKNTIFELVGERIYLRSELTQDMISLCSTNDLIAEAISSFPAA